MGTVINKREYGMKHMKIIGYILIAIGIIIIVSALAMHFTAIKKSETMVKEYMEYVDSMVTGTTEGATEGTTADTGVSAVQTTTIAQGVMGLIKIDKINLIAPVAEGTDNKSIQYALGHFKNTALPGQIGNFAVAGHRSYTFGEYFSRLDEVEVGDKIQVIYGKSVYNYVVDASYVVAPTHTEVLDPTENATITLVTCTPKWTATHRLIVKGHLEVADE